MKKYYTLFLFIFVFILPSFLQAQWRALAPMPTPRWGACAAEIDGWIYVIGGKNQTGYLKTVERYSPQLDKWETSQPELIEKRANAASAIYDGKIFILGGENDQGILDKVEFFDLQQQKWIEFNNLKIGRNTAGAAVFQGRLLVLGGSDNQGNNLNDVEFYNTQTQNWEIWQELTLPFSRFSMGIEVKEDTLYLIGGNYFGPISTIDRYSKTLGWETIATLSHPRYNLSTAMLGDSLFIMGGLGFDKLEISMEIWSSSSSKKIFEGNMTSARLGMASSVFNNEVFLFGGDQNNPPSDQPLNLAEKFISPLTGIIDENNQNNYPQNYILAGNYPNPMKSQTNFWIQPFLNKPNEKFVLIIYDILGKEIWRHQGILQGNQNSVIWNGKNFDNYLVSPGVYFYKIFVAEHIFINKVIVLR